MADVLRQQARPLPAIRRGAKAERGKHGGGIDAEAERATQREVGERGIVSPGRRARDSREAGKESWLAYVTVWAWSD